jgi:vanillate O-demethylase monooxygenase subunit
MAAWEQEIEGTGILARTFLGEPVMLFRKQDGTGYAMLADRCPHRFAPLSLGKRDGDLIQCPYHGLTFDQTGACVRNPIAIGIPQSAKVSSYPVVARDRIVWFWPGDPSRADPGLIPDFSFMHGRNLLLRRSWFNGNYELLTDNLMDLSHVDFVHTGTFNNGGAHRAGSYRVKEDNDGAIWSRWNLPVLRRPPFLAGLARDDVTIVQELDMRWHPPASMMLEIHWLREGSTREQAIYRMQNPHIATPETESSSHYFWTCDPTPEAESFARAVFDDEDKPMIEAVQRRMGNKDFWDLNPVILSSDAGGIHCRRRLLKLLRGEATTGG